MVQLSTPGVTPNRGINLPWGAFCQITSISCLHYICNHPQRQSKRDFCWLSGTVKHQPNYSALQDMSSELLFALLTHTHTHTQTRGGSICRTYFWHIADIDNIRIVSYRRFRYRFFNISTSYRWQVKYRWFFDILLYFSRLFNVTLKTNNYMSKTEYLICQCYIVTSLLVRNGS